MKCRKCKVEIPENSKFCNACGAKQETTHNSKARGNGLGSVYQLPNKKWIAIRTVGYEPLENGKTRRITRSKSGFKTKREAIEYLPLLKNPPKKRAITFKGLYDLWLPNHRAGKSTIDCYKAAMTHFSEIWFMSLDDITVDDLQECLDDCEKGKRTKENMKTLAGLLYKYAIPRHFATLNMGQYLTVRGGENNNKEALPDEAVKALENHIDIVPGADYILCQCYLGFRPSEFLALDAMNYNRKERAFVGGAKTEAGKNRVVTVSPKIQSIINKLVKNKLSGPVFCSADGSPMSIKSYRALFYSVLEKCGIENPVEETNGIKRRKYTPHSCRHTFATMMKRVSGADRDKLALIGHTSTEMLRYYQDVSYDDLRKVTDAI